MTTKLKYVFQPPTPDFTGSPRPTEGIKTPPIITPTTVLTTTELEPTTTEEVTTETTEDIPTDEPVLTTTVTEGYTGSTIPDVPPTPGSRMQKIINKFIPLPLLHLIE